MKQLTFVLLVSMLLAACGGGSIPPSTEAGKTTVSPPVSTTEPSAGFLATEEFSFRAAVNANTLEPAPQRFVTFYNSFQSGLGRSYVIATVSDLEQFNQKLSATETKVSLSDLDRYTYFLMKSPSCPDLPEYAGYTYKGDDLVISVNNFRRINVLCVAVVTLPYYVLRAQKN